MLSSGGEGYESYQRMDIDFTPERHPIRISCRLGFSLDEIFPVVYNGPLQFVYSMAQDMLKSPLNIQYEARLK